MTTTRTGKIARLPKLIRDELNQRIDDGTPGPQLLRWLNAHAEVQSILEQCFGGHPISKQNLSEWRQGGYQDWLQLQENRNLVRQLCDQQPASSNFAISPSLSVESPAFRDALEFFQNDYIESAKMLLRQTTDPEQRWKIVCDVEATLTRIRRDDQRAKSLALSLQRWRQRQAAKKPAQAQPSVAPQNPHQTN